MRALALSKAVVVSLAALAAVAATADSVRAQILSKSSDTISRYISPLTLVNGQTVDRVRTDQIFGKADVGGFMIRSASSLTPWPKSKTWWSASLVAPVYFAVNNDSLPFSINDGATWAGVGTSSSFMAGVQLTAGPVRLILAPEVISADNGYWQLRDTIRFYAPPVPSDRKGGGFVFPWYATTPYSIDLPMRFGNKSLHRLDAGQSTLTVSKGGVGVGVSNENQWWGPGIRNALILSNNAPGFPHFFVRSDRPIRTRFGDVEAKLLVGGLTESHYFDTLATNNVRSISAAAVTFRPKLQKNLVLGMYRSVYGTTSGWGDVSSHLLDAFSNVPRTSRVVPSDSAGDLRGKEQILSLSARWVFPADGFEAYTEWSRLELPYSFRDLLVAPNHSQGYTLGVQWARQAFREQGKVRLQAEGTSVEQSATWRDRPQGSYYTSRVVIQGYTQMGQSLAASIGPGASGQWLAADYIEPNWSFGLTAGRIRWNEDIHSIANFPIYLGYCSHDVSVFPGARASASSRFGYISADVQFGNRLDAFFQEQSGCPRGNSIRDIRNRTISLTLGTFTAGRTR